MVDVEILLAEGLGWDLHAIDRTDIESLLPFFFRWIERKTGEPAAGHKTIRVYCDQVDELWK